MLTPEQNVRIIAQSYYDAAVAGGEMPRAVEALEAIRAVMREERLFKIWDEFDAQIGKTSDLPLRGVLMAHRSAFIAQAGTSEQERLRAAFAADPEAGWNNWLATFGDMLNYLRTEYAHVLLDLPFPPERAEQVEQIRVAIDRMNHERWPEARAVFEFFAQNEAVAVHDRVQILIYCAQVQSYYLYDMKQAEAWLKRAEALAPDDPRVVTAWGEYELQDNQLAKARAHFQDALRMQDDTVTPYLLMGDSYDRENDFDSAEEWYRQAVKHFSGNADAYQHLIRLNGRPQRFEAHEAEFADLAARSIAVEPDAEYRSYLEVGTVYQQNKRFEQAHTWFDKAVALDPARIGAYIAKGNAYIDAEDYDRAQSVFTQAVQIAPEAFDGYWGLAWLYERRGDCAEALRWYEASLEHRPESEPMIRSKIGEMKWKLGDRAEGEADIAAALHANPQDPTAFATYENLAQSYADDLGDLDAAQRVYAAIRDIRGETYDGDYHNRLGNLFYDHNRYDEAVVEYRKALAVAPDSAIFHGNLGRALRELHSFDEALAEIKTAFSLDGAEQAYHRELALTYNSLGNQFYERSDYATATADYRLALEHDPTDPVFHSNLALGLENLKTPQRRVEELRETAVELERALELAPDKADYSTRLASLRTRFRLIEQYGESILDQTPTTLPILLELGSSFVPTDLDTSTWPLMTRYIPAMRNREKAEMGVLLPGVRIRDNLSLLPNEYRFMLYEAPVLRGQIPAQQHYCPHSAAELESLGINSWWLTDRAHPLDGSPGCWVAEWATEAVQQAGLELWDDPLMFVAYHLEATLRRSLSSFVGVQETAFQVSEWKKIAPDLVTAAVPDDDAVVRLSRVLRALLDGGASVTDWPAILTAVREVGLDDLDRAAGAARLRMKGEAVDGR